MDAPTAAARGAAAEAAAPHAPAAAPSRRDEQAGGGRPSAAALLTAPTPAGRLQGLPLLPMAAPAAMLSHRHQTLNGEPPPLPPPLDEGTSVARQGGVAKPSPMQQSAPAPAPAGKGAARRGAAAVVMPPWPALPERPAQGAAAEPVRRASYK